MNMMEIGNSGASRDEFGDTHRVICCLILVECQFATIDPTHYLLTFREIKMVVIALDQCFENQRIIETVDRLDIVPNRMDFIGFVRAQYCSDEGVNCEIISRSINVMIDSLGTRKDFIWVWTVFR